MLCPACFTDVTHLAPALQIQTAVSATPVPVEVCRDCFGRYINVSREATMRAVQSLTPLPLKTDLLPQVDGRTAGHERGHQNRPD